MTTPEPGQQPLDADRHAGDLPDAAHGPRVPAVDVEGQGDGHDAGDDRQ